MKRHLVIAPHLDDENIWLRWDPPKGCGSGRQSILILVTTLYDGQEENADSRQATIEKVIAAYSCSEFIQLSHAPATLDQVPKASLSASCQR